ncbi:MAG: fimbrillin family protein, partial [Rikenellaceae bacterium]
MKRIFTSAAVMAAVALSSCTNESTVVPSATEADAISFGTFLDTTTKGTVLTNTELKETGFGVFGFATEQDAFDGTQIPDFMYNQEVTSVSEAWTYTPTKYWSNVLYDNYTFFAYAPYSEFKGAELYTKGTGISMNSSNKDAGAPKLDFTVKSNPVNMVDFVAGQVMDAEQQSYDSEGTTSTPKVEFNLKHQLTRVSFSATSNIVDDESTAVVITGMKFITGADYDFYETGTYTFATEDSNSSENDHDQDGTWSGLAAFAYGGYDIKDAVAMGKVSFGKYSNSEAILISDAEAELINDEYLFLLPPNGTEGMSAHQKIEMLVSYDIVTIDSSLAAGYSISSKEDAIVSFKGGSGILKQGNAYNFELSFDLTAVELSATSVDWGEEYLSTSTGTDIGIGNYYYEDDYASTVYLNAGMTVDIDVIVEPFNATYPEYTWNIHSQYPAVATTKADADVEDEGVIIINEDGQVEALDPGYAFIYATSANNNLEDLDMIKVWVKEPISAGNLSVSGLDAEYFLEPVSKFPFLDTQYATLSVDIDSETGYEDKYVEGYNTTGFELGTSNTGIAKVSDDQVTITGLMAGDFTISAIFTGKISGEKVSVELPCTVFGYLDIVDALLPSQFYVGLDYTFRGLYLHTWDKKIASVDWSLEPTETSTIGDGKISFTNNGTYTLTATAHDANGNVITSADGITMYTDNCEVEAVDVTLSGIEITDAPKDAIDYDDEGTLACLVTSEPEGLNVTEDYKIWWWSNDTSVIEIDKKTGEYVAVGPGTAKVIATANMYDDEGNKTGVAKSTMVIITVNQPAEGVIAINLEDTYSDFNLAEAVLGKYIAIDELSYTITTSNDYYTYNNVSYVVTNNDYKWSNPTFVTLFGKDYLWVA